MCLQDATYIEYEYLIKYQDTISTLKRRIIYLFS